MNKARVQELYKALDDENISYGEISEIDSAAERLGITQTDEMTSIDVLQEIEARL